MTLPPLLTADAVRRAASRMLQEALANKLKCWTVDIGALPAIADLVASITRQNYPDLVIPFHSRWRHFAAGGVDRWAQLQATWRDLPPRELARRAFDLVIPSVLTDAGSGGRWSYTDPATGKPFASSEGLALASLELYRCGSASSTSGAVEAGWLEGLSESRFAQLFQVSEANPLAGVSGRVELLRSLGKACHARPEIFAAGGPARPGGLVDCIFSASHNGAIAASKILTILLDALGPIWPSRLSLDGIPLGDSWVYSPWQTGATPDANTIVPFHKLSQWMTFSLIEPLQEAGLVVRDIDGLTGLAEYRNGGLFVDGNVLKPKDPAMLDMPHAPDSLLVIEWRALTVALLDKLKPMAAERLGLTVDQFPLPCLLEGGTWAAGRHLAQSLRKDRSPPINMVTDGTVF
jgi:Protein of unknown function (DUF1688)